jgi:hypothetical protein
MGGIVALTLDFELAWAYRLHPDKYAARRRFIEGAPEAVRQLLGLLVETHTSACWAVLGAMCAGERGPPGLPEMAIETANRLCPVPVGSDERRLWFAPEAVRQIADCRQPQELGCHSFAHEDFASVNEDVAKESVRLSVAVVRCFGGPPRSWVFPRNRPGHLPLLKAHGLTCYRGTNSEWYWRLRPAALAFAARMADDWFAHRPPVLQACLHDGLWEVPHSMFFAGTLGARGLVSLSRQVARAKKGIEAARRGGVFHLWTHPHNLGWHTRSVLQALGEVLDAASRCRQAGDVQCLSMGEVASRAAIGTFGGPEETPWAPGQG